MQRTNTHYNVMNYWNIPSTTEACNICTDLVSISQRGGPFHGGMLAGHDLFNPAYEGVLEAALEHVP